VFEGGLIEIEARETVDVRAVGAWGRRGAVTAHARREVVVEVLRGLVEAVCVVAAMRRLQEGVVRHVVGLGRHDGLLELLCLEGVVVVVELTQRVVRLVLEVLGEGGVCEVRRGSSVAQGVEGVGYQ
jgi:hypothetical protein